MSNAIAAGQSVLLIGETGSGKTTLVQSLLEKVTEFETAIASYDGSVNQCLISIAEQLGIPTTNEKGRPLKGDQLKEEIAANCDHSTLIICENSHRWAASLRYWLEILHGKGVVLVLTAIEDLRKDIFVRCTKIELSTPSESAIRELMIREAIAVGLDLSPSKLAYLQQLAGSNPFLAKKIVAEASTGRHIKEGQHNQYVNVAPFINGAFAALGIIRFMGLGLGDRSLYIFGGIAMLIAMSLRYVGVGLNQAAKRKPLGKR